MATGDKRRKNRKSVETTEKYMDAAEALYIQFGYDGTSIRAISKRTRLSLSTVVYHWGTKEELFRSVFKRRFQRVEQLKANRLRAIRDRGAPVGPDDIDAVFEAVVYPGFDDFEDPATALLTRQLYVRVLTDPSPVVHKINEEVFREVMDLWRELSRQCVPELDDEQFFWRRACATGALIFAQSFGSQIARANRIDHTVLDWDAAPREIVGFMTRGMRGG